MSSDNSATANKPILRANNNDDSNKEYTDLDEFRTRALKNTQEEFQFHRKETLFFDK